MNILKKILDNSRVVWSRLVCFITRKYPHFFSDKTIIKAQFYRFLGYKLDLKHPKTFSEKLQWLKLYDRNPLYTVLTDKVKVKEYVAAKIGKEYIIPTLGVWDKPEDIDFNSLPNQFVLKCNHNSGIGLFICRKKNEVSADKWAKVVLELNNGLKEDYYLRGREWPYKNISRKILAERFMSDDDGNISNDLKDYKWYCFNGKPLYCQVIADRRTKETIDFYDTDWKHQDFIGLNPIAVHSSNPVAKPENLIEMVNIAKALSVDTIFSRIDLYNICGRIYFGEITFYPQSGFGVFHPSLYNNLIGDLLKLPNE